MRIHFRTPGWLRAAKGRRALAIGVTVGVLAALPILSACGGQGAGVGVVRTEWSYHGDTGPEQWADMNPAWSLARTGREQSPVDIVTANVQADPTLGPLEFNHHAASREGTHELAILSNGHTVEVTMPAGNTVTFKGVEYELLQFHFHAPSEHTVNGASEALEAHLVHQNTNGDLLVVGVL